MVQTIEKDDLITRVEGALGELRGEDRGVAELELTRRRLMGEVLSYLQGNLGQEPQPELLQDYKGHLEVWAVKYGQ